MKPNPPDRKRRELLATARNVGAAGVVASVLPAAGAAVPPRPAAPAEPEDPGHAGYRDTARNRTYYRLARY